MKQLRRAFEMRAVCSITLRVVAVRVTTVQKLTVSAIVLYTFTCCDQH
jgi:hypothetical protein